jgi:hypothetical protein
MDMKRQSGFGPRSPMRTERKLQGLGERRDCTREWSLGRPVARPSRKHLHSGKNLPSVASQWARCATTLHNSSSLQNRMDAADNSWESSPFSCLTAPKAAAPFKPRLSGNGELHCEPLNGKRAAFLRPSASPNLFGMKTPRWQDQHYSRFEALE